MDWSRRRFVSWAGRLGLTSLAALRASRLQAQPALLHNTEKNMTTAETAPPPGKPGDLAFDSALMQGLAKFTASFLDTAPNPFGCEIVNTLTGERLMQAMNAVGPENDPSAHAEVRTMRLACAKLKSPSLKGYTLYTTCEPCPMCMADALWANVDRVVFGASIADANRFCKQIRIPATEVVERSDMQCIVTGPFEREICVAIFEDPRMQAAFKRWTSAK